MRYSKLIGCVALLALGSDGIAGGYLENMYGGMSGELLRYPVASRLALGVEVAYAKQRDFDMLFGFQDYDVVTGHASAYYDLGNGFTTQVDVGRYLAKDWGATFGLDREFNNGFKIGGYFTLTDVSFDDFGEGITLPRDATNLIANKKRGQSPIL